MYSKILFFCALALVKTISTQYMGPFNGMMPAEAFGCAGPYPFATPFADAMGPFAASPFAEAMAFPGAPFVDGCAGPYAPIAFAETIAIPIGLTAASLSASRGPGLSVTSYSPIAPTGVSMVSDNSYEGALAVSGSIPFLGAVALEGALPTIGAGSVTYGCGNGNVAIMSEDFAAPGFNAFPGPYAYDGAGPYGFDGAYGPFGYDGFAGPFGYDGVAGPAYGRCGYGPYY